MNDIRYDEQRVRIRTEGYLEGAESIVLEVLDLHKRFGAVEVIRGFTARVEQSSIVALVGGNGAGKSTIINLISGFMKADVGTVTVMGRDVTGLSPRKISQCGLGRTFQEVRIFPQLTVLENVLVAVQDRPFQLRRTSSDIVRSREALDLVGLSNRHHVRAEELSYAEQKFLSIARAMARRPLLLLMDEPASGLDTRSYQQLQKLIEEVRQQGSTIVVVEHNLEFVRNVASEILFLEHGVCSAKGPPEEIMRRPDLMERYFGG